MARLLALLCCLVALSAAAAPRIDWTRRVVATSTGAYVMGNPAAPMKLVEYVSYTCPHCAHYVAESKDVVRRDYVASGRTSVEVRHAVRDRLDFIATLVARCGGAARFFGNSEAIFAAQEAWIEKGAAYESANADKLNAMPRDEALKVEARESGLAALVEARGVSAAQIDKCLADPAQQKLVGDMADQAWNGAHIPGTPAFAINGAIIPNAASWAALQPALKAAQK
jgi:protein-disulfide isomerase